MAGKADGSKAKRIPPPRVRTVSAVVVDAVEGAHIATLALEHRCPLRLRHLQLVLVVEPTESGEPGKIGDGIADSDHRVYLAWERGQRLFPTSADDEDALSLLGHAEITRIENPWPGNAKATVFQSFVEAIEDSAVVGAHEPGNILHDEPAWSER
jgi:hypothetical protein